MALQRLNVQEEQEELSQSLERQEEEAVASLAEARSSGDAPPSPPATQPPKAAGCSRYAGLGAASVAAALVGVALLAAGHLLAPEFLSAAPGAFLQRNSRGWCTAVQEGSVALGTPLVTAACHPELPEQRLEIWEDKTIRWLAHPNLCAGVGPKLGEGYMLLLSGCDPSRAEQQLLGFCLSNSNANHFGVAVIVHACPGAPQAVPAGGSPSAVPTAPRVAKFLGDDLFCWMAVLPGSHEVELSALAESRHTGIYACDAHKVYDSHPAPVVQYGSGWLSTANTDVFIEVWKGVMAEGIWAQFSWTIKTDPDCVWIPQRLRPVLLKWRVPADEPAFVKNTWLGKGFLGPIEIFSQSAVALLQQKISQCREKDRGGHEEEEVGEDGFLRLCLEEFGSAVWSDEGILSSSNWADSCNDHSFIAYHPFKTAWEYGGCLDKAM